MKTKERKICRICGKEIGIQGFSWHLNKLHNIKFHEYVLDHLNDFPDYHPCIICGKICHGTTCSHKCNGIRNGQLSKEIGRTKGKNNPMCRPGVAKKAAETRKKNGIWKGRTGKHFTEESRKKMSDTRKRLGLGKGEKNGMYHRNHTPEAIQKIFSKRPMNKLEKQVADFLDIKNISYHFQFFIIENKLCKLYDFKIKDKNLIIEVDGDYWHGGKGCKKYHNHVEETKQNDILKNQMAERRGFKVYRIWESDLQQNKEKVLNKILTLL